MSSQNTSDTRAEAQAELVAKRPEAEKTFRQINALKRVGKMEKGQAARLKAAREVLIRTGGLPID